ncbi:MAG: hypothetical protein LBQ46_03295, partial [Treponema sp.]|nr:hypothetical protein [Treponema sp.]
MADVRHRTATIIRRGTIYNSRGKKQRGKKRLTIEPGPKLFDCALKAHGFGPGSWKKWSNRTKVRPTFSTKFKVAYPKLQFWISLRVTKYAILSKYCENGGKKMKQDTKNK